MCVSVCLCVYSMSIRTQRKSQSREFLFYFIVDNVILASIFVYRALHLTD